MHGPGAKDGSSAPWPPHGARDALVGLVLGLVRSLSDEELTSRHGDLLADLDGVRRRVVGDLAVVCDYKTHFRGHRVALVGSQQALASVWARVCLELQMHLRIVPWPGAGAPSPRLAPIERGADGRGGSVHVGDDHRWAAEGASVLFLDPGPRVAATPPATGALVETLWPLANPNPMLLLGSPEQADALLPPALRDDPRTFVGLQRRLHQRLDALRVRSRGQ